MVSIDENIKVLSRAVLSDVQGDAEQILAEAKTKAEQIRQRAQEQAEAERAKILEQASVEAERVRSQVVATNQLKSRTMLLEQREKLLEEVFSIVRQRLASVQRDSDYDKIAQRLFREGELLEIGLCHHQRSCPCDILASNQFVTLDHHGSIACVFRCIGRFLKRNG